MRSADLEMIVGISTAIIVFAVAGYTVARGALRQRIGRLNTMIQDRDRQIEGLWQQLSAEIARTQALRARLAELQRDLEGAVENLPAAPSRLRLDRHGNLLEE